MWEEKRLRELAKRQRVGSSYEGLSTDEADSAEKNWHLYKIHKTCCVFTAPKLQSTTRELEIRWSSCCSWFQRKFAGWIWSNRSWKRLLHQNLSFLLGICCLQSGNSHPPFWLHFRLFLSWWIVCEREFGPSHSWNSKNVSCESETVSFFESFFAFLKFWLCFLIQFLTLFFFLQTFLLDDCGPHFHCYEVMNDLLCERAQKHEIETIGVNFFAQHHGKSAVDSHFSHVSRAVSQWIVTEHLTNINDLKKAITSDFEQSKTSVTKNSTPTTHSNQNKFCCSSQKKLNLTENCAHAKNQNKIYCSSSSEVDSPWEECQIKKM